MLRLKRADHQLVFEFKPPFDEVFFQEFRSTINDFMKIGKKSFCYDFKHVEELSPESSVGFEDIINILKSGKCHLTIQNMNEKILSRLPEHLLYLKNQTAETSRSIFFDITHEIDNESKISIIYLSGDFIEQEGLEKFKNLALELLPKSVAIIVDFTKLRHISTTAIGGLIFLQMLFDKEKKFAGICNVQPQIKSTLDMSGILQIIPLYDTWQQAKTHIKQT